MIKGEKNPVVESHTRNYFLSFKLAYMTKDSTPSLFVNSPVRKSLQRSVQNQTLWTVPLVAILFASLIRWIVALYPYSGKTPQQI